MDPTVVDVFIDVKWSGIHCSDAMFIVQYSHLDL